MSQASQALQFLILVTAGYLQRRQLDVIAYLQEENRVLREQLGGKRLRLTDAQRRRLAAKAKSLGRKKLMALATLVTADALLRWYRELIAQKYDGSNKRHPGRPPVDPEIRVLVLQMARENSRWGYRRIVGQMAVLGHTVSRSTVRRILIEVGIDPAPERGKHTTWKQFLQVHWDGLCATDFFTVEVITAIGLVRYYVLFVIKLKNRHVEIAGIVRQPCHTWIKQVARNLTDCVAGFLRNTTYLIHDRDPLFCKAFTEILKSADVKTVKLPPKSPNLNAYAERFVLSIKTECLGYIIPLGENHLRRVVNAYVDHYQRERTHQGVGNVLLTEASNSNASSGAVVCHQRLGGLLKFYHREAA